MLSSKHVLWATVELLGVRKELPANVFHSWSLSSIHFLCRFFFFKMHICELNWYVLDSWSLSCLSLPIFFFFEGDLEAIGVPCFFSAFHVRKFTVTTDHESGIMLESFRTVQCDHGEGTCSMISGVVVCF